MGTIQRNSGMGFNRLKKASRNLFLFWTPTYQSSFSNYDMTLADQVAHLAEHWFSTAAYRVRSWDLGWLWSRSLTGLFSRVFDTYPGFLHQYRPCTSTEDGAYRQCTSASCLLCWSYVCMRTRIHFGKKRKVAIGVAFCIQNSQC